MRIHPNQAQWDDPNMMYDCLLLPASAESSWKSKNNSENNLHQMKWNKYKSSNTHHHSLKSATKNSHRFAWQKGLRRFTMSLVGDFSFSLLLKYNTLRRRNKPTTINTYKNTHYTQYGIWVIVIQSYWPYIYTHIFIYMVLYRIHNLCFEKFYFDGKYFTVFAVFFRSLVSYYFIFEFFCRSSFDDRCVPVWHKDERKWRKKL